MIISSSLLLQRAQKKHQNVSDKLTYRNSRITKKNQFIERIAGIVLKRISRSKEFIPTENTLYSQTQQLIELSFITRDSLNPNQPCGNPSLCEGFETTIRKRIHTVNPFLSFVLLPQGFKGERQRLEPTPFAFSFQRAQKKYSYFTNSHNKKVRRLSILCIKTKITSVSIITTIATSNRCELDSLENLFSRESLRLGRRKTQAYAGTAVVVIMKISKELECSPYGTPIKSF